jgi:hypothetical protein
MSIPNKPNNINLVLQYNIAILYCKKAKYYIILEYIMRFAVFNGKI